MISTPYPLTLFERVYRDFHSEWYLSRIRIVEKDGALFAGQKIYFG